MTQPIVTPNADATWKFGREGLDRQSPAVHLLRNQRMVTMVTGAGSGYVQYSDKAVTRWHPDPTCGKNGYFIYLRDLDTGKIHSATYQPTVVEPSAYNVEFRSGSAVFSRQDGELRTDLQVFLAPYADAEVRKLTITNEGSSPRRLEVTSYAEIVLQHAKADAGHLAYSKLFVETWQHESGALFARRRPRESSNAAICAAHFYIGSKDLPLTAFETDRKQFIGRGNALDCPAALRSSSETAGKLGPVLDPIFSLRTKLTLRPQESISIPFVLCVGENASDLEELIQQMDAPDYVDEALAQAENAESGYHFSNERSFELAEAASRVLHRKNTEIDPGVLDKQLKDFLGFYDIDSPSPLEVTREPSAELPEKSAATPQIGENTVSEPLADLADGFGDDLKHENGFGGFTQCGTEYVIRLPATGDENALLPPLPWTNVISNENIGFIASETGAGYTWAGNSRLNRLTPWQNDPVIDAHGEVIYLRDEYSKAFWTITPGPVRQAVDYEIRHGFGYTSFRHCSHGIIQELCQYVPLSDQIKICRVRLTNLTEQTRSISVYSYHQWELGDGDWDARRGIEVSAAPQMSALLAANRQRGVFAGNSAFAKLATPSDSKGYEFTCDRFEFLGSNGSLASPLALAECRDLSGRAGTGIDPCAVSKSTIEIAAGATVEFAVLLGEGSSVANAEKLLAKYGTSDSWSAALEETRTAWSERLGAVQIKTPEPAIDLLVNGWLPYQNLSCRVWGRSSHYQSGGAYGYRDQLQDAAALVHHLPELTREQIIRHAAHQFVEGDVQHWWHTPHSLGIRTTFSDDLLWLPLFAAEYVETTGDQAFWDEEVPFLAGQQLPAGVAEVMLTPSDSGNTGSIYEHCCRALDRGLTTGRNGLPLMGCGDWNDGMNRVGAGGTGESVWMGFFIDYILGKMLPVCEALNDNVRLECYLGYREQLRTALHDAGWDGGWYRRAYFDDGTPLGTAAADECQIDALVQAWAVLSGADTSERAEAAMSAAVDRLVDEDAGLIQLLDPPFDKMENDPGYIKGYLPGVRENGGQYTHGVLWFVRAMAELGHGTRAANLLKMISPISHTDTSERVATYQAEPYVVAADVYSQAPHAGRAGWSWYTGSAGWMWRVAVESILGVKLVCGKTLRVDPRVNSDWPECCVKYRLSDHKTVYELLIRNPRGQQFGVSECEVDGEEIPIEEGVANIPLEFDGATHKVVVTL